MKIAIFHDYIGTIGGGEKLVLTLARGLGADVITTDVDADSVKMPPLKQISASLRFALCDFSKKYDFFIFSGNWAHYAARRHKSNFSHRELQTVSTSAGASPRPPEAPLSGGGLNENPALN